MQGDQDIARSHGSLGLSSVHQIVALDALGYRTQVDREASAKAGFDAHLTKPVVVSELTRLLDGFFA